MWRDDLWNETRDGVRSERRLKDEEGGDEEMVVVVMVESKARTSG